MHTASMWPMTTWQTTRKQATQTFLVRATDDRLGSPPHPWYKRLKNIEAERSQEQAQREVQIPVNFQGFFESKTLKNRLPTHTRRCMTTQLSARYLTCPTG